MKANEFFKKHGWNDTKVMIESPFGLGEYEYLWDDLKRLVESHELVASWGGLADAKVAVKVSRHKKYLKRAIADVESCMEVNQ
ncbi:hypothetical protein HADU_06789 [Acinetobacter sp. HA]|uniref:hypothetical protein n=1 Tax=Acinetobacter sp. HA TaxID=1173062 RepID=UPI000263DBF5|nr:hypothetical protein [Acinetobacter sp. HA]EIM39533.1 hypothetical protein HADU_06789 [Acinetobacter sp. HA]